MLKFYGGLLLRTLQPQALKTQQSVSAHDAAEAPTSSADIEATLVDLCAIPPADRNGVRQPIPSGRFKMIADFVKGLDQYSNRRGKQVWYLRPRLFTVLRGIQALTYMDHFIKAGHCDAALPFDEHTLPDFMRNTHLRRKFLDFQVYVLTDARRLESEWADEHIHFPAESANDHFHIHRKLGNGGFGSVDAVFSKLSLKLYARKVYHREKDTKRQQYIIDEIKLMKTFSHRHLTKIVGSYSDTEYIAYLMEPVADLNLHQYLRWLGGLSGYEAEHEGVALRNYFGCLAGALNYLHQNKVRHRDIKPQNILLKDRKIYVADFGAAVEWTSKSKRGTTQSYNAPRSPEYMAPEVDDRNPRNAASDMWSLGIVFLEMLTVLKGLTLVKWKEHLKKKSRIPAEPWPCRNPTALGDWMTMLQSHGSLHESDNEPLMWVRELLQHKPDRRYTSQSLVRTISDSGYFHDFTCFDCIREFNQPAYFDTNKGEEQPNRAAYEDQIAVLLRTSQPPERHISDARAQTIDDWIRGTTEHLPVSITTKPEDCFDHDILPEDGQISIRYQEPSPATQVSVWESGNTSFWEPYTSMPGAFISDDDPEEPIDVFLQPEEPFEAEIQTSEPPASTSDGDLFDVVQDSSSVDPDDISIGDVPEAAQDLQTIVEEDTTAEATVVPRSGLDAPLKNRQDESRPDECQPAPQIEMLHEHQTTILDSSISRSAKIENASSPVEHPPSPQLTSSDVNRASNVDPSNGLGIVFPCGSLENLQRLGEVEEDRTTRSKSALPSPPETPASRKVSLPPPSDQWQSEAPPPYTAYPSPPTSPRVGFFPTETFAEKQDAHEVTSQDPPTPSRKKPSKPKKPTRQKASSHRSPRSPPNRSFNPSDFSPVKYIEDAWQEMEAAQSLATSVMSEATAKRLRGPLLKKFDHDYSYMENYAKEGNSAAVKQLIERGCNPGTRQKPRPKPLLLAIKGCSERHNKCVKALVRAGCDVNARFRKKTPVHWAVERPYFNGHLKLLALLLGAGAEMNTPDGEGDFPLLKLLTGLPDEPLEDYQVKALALILHPQVLSPVDVNVRQAVSLNTALHIAVQRRSPTAVAVLIHHGADVNATNASATTPLLMAATQWRGNLTLEQEMILSFLLQSDVLDVDVKGGSLERTALHHAAAAGCATALGMLLERGADALEVVDKKGMNALQVLGSVREKIPREVFEEMWEMLRV